MRRLALVFLTAAVGACSAGRPSPDPQHAAALEEGEPLAGLSPRRVGAPLSGEGSFVVVDDDVAVWGAFADPTACAETEFALVDAKNDRIKRVLPRGAWWFARVSQNRRWLGAVGAPGKTCAEASQDPDGVELYAAWLAREAPEPSGPPASFGPRSADYDFLAGRLLVFDKGRVRAFDPKTHEVKWSAEIAGPTARASAFIEDGTPFHTVNEGQSHVFIHTSTEAKFVRSGIDAGEIGPVTDPPPLEAADGRRAFAQAVDALGNWLHAPTEAGYDLFFLLNRTSGVQKTTIAERMLAPATFESKTDYLAFPTPNLVAPELVDVAIQPPGFTRREPDHRIVGMSEVSFIDARRDSVTVVGKTRDERIAIATAAPNDSTFTVVAEPPGEVTKVRVTGDASRVVFIGRDALGGARLFSAPRSAPSEAGALAPRDLGVDEPTDFVLDDGAAPSAAFVLHRDGSSLVALDGSAITPLPKHDFAPVWGSGILFFAESGSASGLKGVTRDGKKDTTLLRGQVVLGAAVSPSGKTLFVSAEAPEGGAEGEPAGVYRIDLARATATSADGGGADGDAGAADDDAPVPGPAAGSDAGAGPAAESERGTPSSDEEAPRRGGDGEPYSAPSSRPDEPTDGSAEAASGCSVVPNPRGGATPCVASVIAALALLGVRRRRAKTER